MAHPLPEIKTLYGNLLGQPFIGGDDIRIVIDSNFIGFFTESVKDVPLTSEYALADAIFNGCCVSCFALGGSQC